MNIEAIVSTHNRRDLTATCLSVLRECTQPETRIIVIDDNSTEYDDNWLKSVGATSVLRYSLKSAGRSAFYRIAQFMVGSTADYALMLDNDALVTPGINRECLRWYTDARQWHHGPLIFSPYRSCCHTVLDDETVESWDGQTWRLMESIGGLSMFMDRATGKHLLETIPEHVWDSTIPAQNGHIGWDWHVSENATCIAPHRSLVEHLGRFGGGANGASADKAVDFVGYGR